MGRTAILLLPALLAACAHVLPRRDAVPIPTSTAPAPIGPAGTSALLESPTGTRHLRSPDLDAPPEIVRLVAPTYPLDLQAAAIEGEATVEFIVGPDGTVTKVAVTAATHRAFADAAAQAVRQWRFKPMTVHGRGVDVYLIQRFPFRLAD